MGRPANIIPRVVVEDCESVKASDALTLSKARPSVHYSGHARTWSAVVPSLPVVRRQGLQTLQADASAGLCVQNLSQPYIRACRSPMRVWTDS
jgi:hypothetical protein